MPCSRTLPNQQPPYQTTEIRVRSDSSQRQVQLQHSLEVASQERFRPTAYDRPGRAGQKAGTKGVLQMG